MPRIITEEFSETLKLLKATVINLQKELQEAEFNLDQALCSYQYNSFNSLDEAETQLYDELYSRASKDCEGSHNCGFDQYSQPFSVGDKQYIAVAGVKYNRHDKTYYYVDSFNLKIVELP